MPEHHEEQRQGVYQVWQCQRPEAMAVHHAETNVERWMRHRSQYVKVAEGVPPYPEEHLYEHLEWLYGACQHSDAYAGGWEKEHWVTWFDPQAHIRSTSVGDVLVDPQGVAWLVVSFGWVRMGKEKEQPNA